jgi:hypothetical protein
MKLSVSAITGNQGVERGLREVYARIDQLDEIVSQLDLEAEFRFLLVSFLDQPVDHFEDVSLRKTILHLEVGYDDRVFSFPLNHDQIVQHIAERICFALSRVKIAVEDREKLIDVRCQAQRFNDLIGWPRRLNAETAEGIRRGRDLPHIQPACSWR